MDQKKLTPVKQIKDQTFYKFPYLDILIATVPAEAINDLWKVWAALIKDIETAGLVLQILVDRGRSSGLQIFLYIERLDVLPEDHRLTYAILACDRKENIFYTPFSSGKNYSSQNLKRLFK